MTTNIQKSAVVVRLKISQWGAERTDKSVSEEVAINKNADDDAGRYVKKLFAGCELLKDIAKVAGKARNVNKAHTLRYLVGQDLLPVGYFDAHAEIVGNYKDIFDALVNDFCSQYEKTRDRQKARLGEMFDEADYPHVDTVREKFSFKLKYEPLSDGNTFDKMFGSEEFEQQLIAEAESEMQERIDEAMHDLWGRLIRSVTLFAEKMKNYTPKHGKTKAKDTFKDSLVQNMRDICEVLPRLNLTGDADLNNYCAVVQDKLANLDAGTLRENPALRKSAADDADAILAQMSGYTMAAE